MVVASYAIKRAIVLSLPLSLIILSCHPQLVYGLPTQSLVRYNATLKLTSERGLVLQDVDGTVVWSTNRRMQPHAFG